MKRPFVVVTESAYDLLLKIQHEECDRSSEKLIASQGITLAYKLLQIHKQGGYVVAHIPITKGNTLVGVLRRIGLMPKYKKVQVGIEYYAKKETKRTVTV